MAEDRPARARLRGDLAARHIRFGVDFALLDLSQPEECWRRYIHSNAGVFYHRCPREFGARFLEYARSILDEPPPELAGQSLDPWLDQVPLPLVIHALGGGRDAMPAGCWLNGSISATSGFRLALRA